MERRERLLAEEQRLLKQQKAVVDKIEESDKQKAMLEGEQKKVEQQKQTKAEQSVEIKRQSSVASSEGGLKKAKRGKKAPPSNTIEIANLPEDFSRSMIDQIVSNYPGVERIFDTDCENRTCLIKFSSVENAKLAVGGLNRFKVDQSGTELSVVYK